ncbi:MAG: IPExxxVDY family protein [Bacteroidales bacterium]|nr:IPExxxVDY family protein [Bacteroidales bacterium]MCF8390114.1 IPExxxVDY family protein [Bacteroidales bacterium]
MIKKLKLDYIPDFNFLLLAILSYEKDYKLVWDINNSLSFDFIREDDYKIFNKKNKLEIGFPSFIYRNASQYIDHRLLVNKSDQGILLEEIRNIDFLMVIKGDYYEGYDKILQMKLQNLETVQSCFIIDVNKLKDKERLLEA